MNTQTPNQTVTQQQLENQAALEAEALAHSLSDGDYTAIANYARLLEAGIYEPKTYVAFVAVLNRRCYRTYQQLHNRYGRNHKAITQFENALALRVYALHQERSDVCPK